MRPFAVADLGEAGLPVAVVMDASMTRVRGLNRRTYRSLTSGRAPVYPRPQPSSWPKSSRSEAHAETDGHGAGIGDGVVVRAVDRADAVDHGHLRIESMIAGKGEQVAP